MKKIFIYIVSAALSFVAFSCAKEADVNPEEVTGGTETQTAENGETPTPEGYVSFSLTADVETVPVKTEIIDGETAEKKIVKWVNGDEIDVLFDGGSSTSAASVSKVDDKEITSFNIDVHPGTTQVYLSYPHGSGAVLNDGAVSLTIPSVQSGAFKDVSYLLATCTVEAGTATFYNAVSFFKISLTDSSIKKAVLSSNSEEALAGTVSYTFNANGLVPGKVSDPSTEITVNFNGTGDYYVATLPEISLGSGVTVKFYREGDVPAGGNRTESALSLRRAYIRSFGDSDRICSRYVSTGGSGSDNGRTSDKPWSVDQFIAFINNGSSTEYSDKLKAQNGLTVHIAAGDYTMPDVDINLGGDFTHLTIKGEEGARFVGNGSKPIIHQNRDNRQNTTVIFDHIEFTGGRRSGDHGGAIWQKRGTINYKSCTFTDNQTLTDGKHGGVLHYYASPVATFEDCTFSGNSTTTSTTSNGGVVNSSSGDNGFPQLTFTRCHFYNNKAGGNGGVLTATAGNAHILFRDCDFGDGTEENKNSATNGGAIDFDKAWEFNVENCRFNGNSAKTGGAIYYRSTVTSKTATANIKGCTFTDNYSTGDGGVLYMSSGKLNIVPLEGTACTFTGNHGSQGGVMNLKGTLELNDTGSIYEGNYSSSYGGVYGVGGDATVNIKSARFGQDGDTGKKNYSETKGGGALNLNGGYITLEKCEFYNSTASGAPGGAIRRPSETFEEFSLTIKGCTFKGNACQDDNDGGRGGAIYFVDGTLTIEKAEDGTRNVFDSNSSCSGGGAICAGGSASVSIAQSDFSKNETSRTNVAGCGGAVNVYGSDSNPDVTITDCTFTSNHSANSGGALGLDNGTSSLKMNKCLFNGNNAPLGGALKVLSTAKGASVYMNSCVLSGDYITNTYGTEIVTDNIVDAGIKLCMNNITIADGTHSKSGNGQQSAWVNLRNSTSLVMSNCTLIGVTRNANGPATSTKPNLLRIDGERKNGATVTLINNIIAQTPADGTFYSSDMQSVDVTGYFNKFSTVLNDSKYTPGDGSASDFRGTSDYFGGLSYVAPSSASDWSWNNCYWSWNGTMAKGSDLTKATLTDVNAKIQTADSDFHAWLSDIGALTTDGRGKERGSSTWPGAYDNSSAAAE